MAKSVRGGTFDYIIVGGGSAGCVLANRLSADPSVSVALIEAGQNDWNPVIRRPWGVGLLIPTSLHNWSYTGAPEAQLDGRAIYHPRGKVLGGSSSINGMIYIRGHARDYDDWRQAGNAGWSYDDVLPYFKRLEDFADKADMQYHGRGGAMRIEAPPPLNALHRAWLAAGAGAGYPVIDDFNVAAPEGFGVYHMNLVRGRRWSAAFGYLTRAVRERKNLAILTGCRVSRIVLQNGRAVGAELAQGRRQFRLTAGEEVILSAGAFNSPQLLQLSGVGPASRLERLGIKVVVDHPEVGENLQDHPDISLTCRCSAPITLNDKMRFPAVVPAMVQGVASRAGALNEFPVRTGAFLRSDPSKDAPDLQYHFAHGAFIDSGKTLVSESLFSVRICVLRPYSKGAVRIRSNDPAAPPKIVTNFLSNANDVETLRAGVRIGQEVIGRPEFDALRGAPYRPEAILKGDAEIDDFLRKHVESVYHPVGTCRMGVDARAVVDPELRVQGVEGLRVADASVMPTLIGGNTNAPTMMIAEKASDMILKRSPPVSIESAGRTAMSA